MKLNLYLQYLLSGVRLMNHAPYKQSAVFTLPCDKYCRQTPYWYDICLRRWRALMFAEQFKQSFVSLWIILNDSGSLDWNGGVWFHKVDYYCCLSLWQQTFCLALSGHWGMRRKRCEGRGQPVIDLANSARFWFDLSPRLLESDGVDVFIDGASENKGRNK